MSGYEEKRQHKRIGDSFIVTYRFVSPVRALGASATGGEFEGVALDLSEGGLGLDTDNELPTGARVEVRFKIFSEHAWTERDKRREFLLNCEVRHSRHIRKTSWRSGLLFKNATDQDREFIQAYVRDQTLAMFGVRV